MDSPVINPSYYADFAGLDSLKKDVKTDDPKAIKAVAQQFESLFTEMMLKSMRAAKLGDGMGESEQTDFYQDMYDQQIALKLSEGKGIGLADMLVQQLSREHLIKGSQAGGAAAATQGAAAANRGTTGGALGGVASGAVGGAIGATTTRAATSNSSASNATTSGAASVSAATRMSFVRNVEPYAKQAAAQLGVSPDALIAQAALETGWGQHVPAAADGGSSYNLFGIKAGGSWGGGAANARTTEYSQGGATSTVQPFRAYTSVQESVDDYVAVLRSNPAYRQALGTGGNIGAFASALQRGGYATDPAYASKLAATADSIKTLRNASLKFAAVLPTTNGAETA